MRRPISRAEALARGISDDQLQNAVNKGDAWRLCQGVYIVGSDPPTDIERALALLIATKGVASHDLAGELHRLDSIDLRVQPWVTLPRKSKHATTAISIRQLDHHHICELNRYLCTKGLQTVIDLAAVVGDLVWEQALESALRKGLTTIAEMEKALPELGRARTKGLKRIRRVLALRPPGAPPTESLLETLAVQLIRSDSTLATPVRQVKVFNDMGVRVARVDLAYPEHGVFLELDGGQHAGQPKYDAIRQTNVVAAMQWRPARFSWDDITRFGNQTLRRLHELLEPPRGSSNSR